MIEQLLKKYGKEIKQTHSSFVIIGDDLVYKIKKPVNFGFLDYSTLEKRYINCKKELELNKRACEELYIDIRPISKINDDFIIGDSSNVVEYCVVMKRVDDKLFLSNMLEKADKAIMKKVGEFIADFHKKAPNVKYFDLLETMKFNTDENFEQTKSFIDITIEKEDYELIKDKTNKFYEKYEELFKERNKKVIDGHGDIRLEHVVINDRVCIMDAIEFNDRFRIGDPINDMCFLSMELEFANKSELSSYYEYYYNESFKDEDFKTFIDFYKCYRAYVRGKVSSFMLNDKNVENKEYYKDIAKKLFKLSLNYAKKIKL